MLSLLPDALLVRLGLCGLRSRTVTAVVQAELARRWQTRGVRA